MFLLEAGGGGVQLPEQLLGPLRALLAAAFATATSTEAAAGANGRCCSGSSNDGALASAAQSRSARQQFKNALKRAAGGRGGVDFWRAQLLNACGSAVQYGGVISAVAAMTSPRGPGCCDCTGLDRAANLATSLPFAAIGARAMRERATPQGRAWGASMVGIAGGSLAFHGSRGRWRALARKIDYWAIAVSSCFLTRAIWPQQPALVTALSLAAVPFKPFAVSTAHALAAEGEFLRRARAGGGDPSLKRAQRAHGAAALAGMTLFFFEDTAPHVPLVHGGWHLCSAAATGALQALLRDAEARQLAAGGGLVFEECKLRERAAAPAAEEPVTAVVAAAAAAVATAAAAAAAAKVPLELPVRPLELAVMA